MKRRLLTIAIFLVAGAVVNVAVAWTAAVRPWSIQVGGVTGVTPHPDSRKVWIAHRVDRLAATRLSSGTTGRTSQTRPSQSAASVLPSWSRVAHCVSDSAYPLVIEDGYGWPMISMSCAWQAKVLSDWRIRSGIELQPPAGPYGPLGAA